MDSKQEGSQLVLLEMVPTAIYASEQLPSPKKIPCIQPCDSSLADNF